MALTSPGAFKSVKFRISIVALLAAANLSACVTADTVDLESRAISVNQASEPAGAAGQVAAQSVAHLLPGSGPTYVTLTVSTSDDNSNTSKSDIRKTAITSGSGYLVSDDGYVMTAAHVAVARGNEISARAANGRVYSGMVVGVLPTNDMAIIKLRGFSGRSVAPAGPGCLTKGDLVYTLGKPHGEGDTARVGTLESKHFGRAVAYGKFGYPDALVLHMGTQRGESGGPVFNGNGQLVGMVVSTLSDTNGQLINLAHAIPSTALANYLCSQTSCGAGWATLANKSIDACG
jgi:S1-C subfamily serine protease